MRTEPVGLLAFYLLWAKRQHWKVPRLHVAILLWLESTDDPIRVLMVFRGAAKSTLFAIYKAWKLYRDRTRRSLIWSEDGNLAEKMTKDVINVLRHHPLCKGMLPRNVGARAFSVVGNPDARNPSMSAYGVLTNATGSRADDVDFDDIEVPKNIQSEEAREKLRNRISESTHILVPGGQETYIGTPHTRDSIYTERIAAGAALLKLQLFAHHRRYEDTTQRTRYPFDRPIGDDGLYVMTGIGQMARVLAEGIDYQFDGRDVIFSEPPGVLLDLYSMSAWPERFTRADIAIRRKKTRTINAWDSNYQLEAKPMAEQRLDPEQLVVYDVEPRLITRNRIPVLMLGEVRLVGVVAYWDCSLGKVDSDASALCITFTDEAGRYYWHRAVGMTGELEEVDDRGLLIGGQCLQLLDVLAPIHVPHVFVEVNGLGGFAVQTLRKHAKRRGISVGEKLVRTNKQQRILDAIEAPLSARYLWAHQSVVDGPAWGQMEDFNPTVRNQADDYLDAEAGALAETPVRVGKSIGIPTSDRRDNWRPSGGVHEVRVD